MMRFVVQVDERGAKGVAPAIAVVGRDVRVVGDSGVVEQRAQRQHNRAVLHHTRSEE